MKKCLNCGELNTNDSLFCANCGNKDFDLTNQIMCPVCKEMVSDSFDYCTQCGAKLRPLEDKPASVDAKPSNVDLGALRGKVNTNIVTAIGQVTPSVISPNTNAIDTKKDAEIANFEDQIVCPHCNQPLTLSNVYCTRCGKAVDSLSQGKLVKRKICPHCKRPNQMSAEFCSYCFTALDNVDFDEFMVNYKSNDKEDDIKQLVLQSSSNKKSKVCPECGSLNDIDTKYCYKCATKLIAQTRKKYCFICGAENTYDAEFCTNCQYSFSKKTANSAEVGVRCECNYLNDLGSLFCTKCGKKLIDKQK
ncbi:MAG: zinc ribbon domain-containing protein [Clostridia bacterium]